MATHDLYNTVVNYQATHQSRSRMASTVQLTHICSKACSCRDVDFVCSNCCFSHSAHWLPTRKKLRTGKEKRKKKKEKRKKKKVWCSLSIHSALSYITAVAFRKISSTALGKLLLAIDIHVTVCGLHATHRPTIIAGLLRQRCLTKVSLLGGVWMANRWLTPRGLRHILCELRENR